MVQNAEADMQIEYLPVLVDERNVPSLESVPPALNPAMIYLAKLHSHASKRTMASHLDTAAKWLERNASATWRSCEWTRLNRMVLLGYADYLRNDKGLALRTINTAMAALRGVAREAWLADLMPENEYRKIKEERHSVGGHKIAKGRALSIDEVKALLETSRLRQSIRGLRDETIVSILALCGLRREELVKLNYEHVNWSDRTLVFTGKGDKERIAILPRTVHARLCEWCERVRGSHKGTLFFAITRGEAITEERLTVDGLHYIVTTLASETGIARCTAHDLRRTFATIQFQNNIDILTVRDNMGHSSVTTTQIYDHRNMDDRRKSTEVMEL